MNPPIAHLWRVQSARSVGTEAAHVRISVRLHQLLDEGKDSLRRYHIRTAAYPILILATSDKNLHAVLASANAPI
jgi:hypothetical protein